MLKQFLMLTMSAFGSDEAVDLSALGMSDFSPYIYERDAKWMVLPLIALFVVFVHLKKNKIKR